MNTKTTITACAAVLLLAGCASTNHESSRSAPSTPAVAMSPGMIMPDGSTMGPAAAAAAAQTRPSTAAQMICTAETRATIKQVLGLTSTPHSTSTWANRLYTCTYALPQGRLTLSVKESASPAAARDYAAALRPRLGPTQALEGLTGNAYSTDSGRVVLTKDNDTLLVDATALPPIVGQQHAKRFDFAYELTSDILGCWTGDDGS